MKVRTNNVAVTPAEAKLIVKYLDGVDSAVTVRLSNGFKPDEDHLTSLLCEMLDENLTALHNLEYPVSRLKEDLTSDPKNLRVNVKIETIKYDKFIESRVNDSDFGVIVKYKDDVLPEASFSKAVLFQAKKLYIGPGFPQYTMNDAFGAFDVDQLRNLAELRQTVPEAPHYLFYCPRSEGYTEEARQVIHRLLVPGSWDIFDYAAGWHRYQLANDHSRHVPGLLVSKLDWLEQLYLDRVPQITVANRTPLPRVRQVFERYWEDTLSFSWFLVYEMLLGFAGDTSPTALALAQGKFSGDDPKFLPRYVITLTVNVGPSPSLDHRQ